MSEVFQNKKALYHYSPTLFLPVTTRSSAVVSDVPYLDSRSCQNLVGLATVYLKHSSLSASRHDTSVGFKLCSAANHITPGQILGSQQIRGLWKIYFKSENTIPKLLQGDFLYDGRKIELFSQDPFETGKIPSESIIFRDLPFSFNNDHITAHLKNSYPDVYIRSNVINGKVRNSDNE